MERMILAVVSRVQTPLKSCIFSGFFTQLHKLRWQPRGSFFIWFYFRTSYMIYFIYIIHRLHFINWIRCPECLFSKTKKVGFFEATHLPLYKNGVSTGRYAIHIQRCLRWRWNKNNNKFKQSDLPVHGFLRNNNEPVPALCSSRARWPLSTYFCLWATRKY